MTRDQYSELIDFLGGKFEVIDRLFMAVEQRFGAIDRRFDSVDEQLDEARRHATVLFEQSQASLRTVAEGLGVRLDRVEFRLDRLETGEVRLED